MFEIQSKKLYLIHWISNHKHRIEEKSTNSSRSSSKVVGHGLADLWEFPTLFTRSVDEISVFWIIFLSNRNFTSFSGCYECDVISKIKPYGFQIPDIFSLRPFSVVFWVFPKKVLTLHIMCHYIFLNLPTVSILNPFRYGMVWIYFQ